MAAAKKKISDNREIITLDYRDHVLQRSGMYIGSTKPTDVESWILNSEDKLEFSKLNYVPAVFKLVNEILDNSIDEGLKTNWEKSNKISVDIDKTTCTIEDNGRGFPVKKNDEGEWMPVNALCKGMTGSNFDDDAERQSIGQNGTGSKCVVIFSKKFECVTCDGNGKLKIVCTDNLASEKHTEFTPTSKTGTKITFTPDFSRLGVTCFDNTIISLIKTRLKFLAWFFPKCTFTFNGDKISIKTKELNSMFPQPVVSFNNENVYICVYPTEDPLVLTYLNGLSLKGGSHVDYIINKVIGDIREKVSKRYKNIKPNDIKNRLGFVVFFKNFPNCSFESQTKEILSNSQADVGEYIRQQEVDLDALTAKILKEKEILDNITDLFRAKEELAEAKLLKNAAKKVRDFDSEKYYPPAGKTAKKYLMIVEGASAFGGLSPLISRQGIGYYLLRGKPLNVIDVKPSKYMENREISELIKILGIDPSDPNTDMTYEKVVVLSDADPDGCSIAGLIISLFNKIAPKMVKDGRICRMDTPLLLGLKGDKVMEYYFEFPDQKAMKKDLKYFYLKGLGSWSKGRWNQVIEKVGGIDSLIHPYEVDDSYQSSIMNWFGKDAEPRKVALRGREFHINNA